MRPIVVGVAGQIGSGKTSVAINLARKLECPVASFGAYVRKLAINRGQGLRREALQKLSEELLASLGAEGLSQNVLASTAWDREHSLVVDGIRHGAVVIALKNEIAPIPFILIYLDARREIRQNRLGDRDHVSAKELNRFELHSTEQDVATGVRELADVVINADGQVAEIVAAAMNAICLRSELS